MVGLAVLTGCERGAVPAEARASVPTVATSRPGPTHIDSFVPRGAALARFQAASRRVTHLAGGASSRNALVRQFVHALEQSDTATLRQLVLSRDEFAFLYYPTSAQGLPPYSLNPDLMWFMTKERSDQGLRRALTQLGGHAFDYRSYRCEGRASVEGENSLWGPCPLARRARGRVVEVRLFGPMLERGGRWKFVSYANKL